MTEIQETQPGTKMVAQTGTGAETGRMKTQLSEETLKLFRIVIGVVLLFPIVQLYFMIPSAISMWVAEPFVPLVNMIYFIIVISIGVWLFQYSLRFSGTEKR
ncbi:MAG: hypothetical protein LUP97_01415 [Methanoregula sp.]|nr:hypothetical protein [Methanoregula sp.]